MLSENQTATAMAERRSTNSFTYASFRGEGEEAAAAAAEAAAAEKTLPE